ncbi:hypothetical protein JCM5350_005281 [Sporobolomyces pararoseus]
MTAAEGVERFVHLVEELHDMIDASEVAMRSYLDDTRLYLGTIWNRAPITNLFRQTVLSKLQHVINSHQATIDPEQVPTLYDIIQSTLSETGGGSWSIAVPKYVFESAIRGLVTGTNNKACKDLNQEMHNSSWFTRWDSYAPDRQLECLGFTYSRMKYMAKLKRDHFLEGGNNRLNQNSPTVRKIRNACVATPFQVIPRSNSPSAQSAQSPTGVSPTTLSNMAPLIDWYNEQRQT